MAEFGTSWRGTEGLLVNANIEAVIQSMAVESLDDSLEVLEVEEGFSLTPVSKDPVLITFLENNFRSLLFQGAMRLTTHGAHVEDRKPLTLSRTIVFHLMEKNLPC